MLHTQLILAKLFYQVGTVGMCRSSEPNSLGWSDASMRTRHKASDVHWAISKNLRLILIRNQIILAEIQSVTNP